MPGTWVSDWAPPAPETPIRLPQALGGWGEGPSNEPIILHYLCSWYPQAPGLQGGHREAGNACQNGSASWATREVAKKPGGAWS